MSVLLRNVTIISLLFITACAGPAVRTKPRPTVRPLPGALVSQSELIVTRDMLMDGFDEDAPVRRFGYILLPPDWLTKKTYRQQLQNIVKAFWEGCAPYQPAIKDKQRGITYWPTDLTSRQSMLVAAAEKKWQRWIDHYHQERAEIIYHRIDEPTDRPLLVVARHPLGPLAGSFATQGMEVLVFELDSVDGVKLYALLRKYQKEIMEKTGQPHWSISRIRRLFKPFYQDRVEDAVKVKILTE